MKKNKIVYSVDDRIGASFQVGDFVENTEAFVKVAGYSSLYGAFDHFDWTLDPIESYPELAKKIESDIVDWEPDLVIIDAEPIVARIAAKHNIPIVNCSALHLLDGVRWKRGQRKYTTVLELTRHKLGELPPARVNLIYSPYGFTGAELKEGYEWIEPYAISVEGQPKHSMACVFDNDRYDSLCMFALRSAENIVRWRGTQHYETTLADAKSILTEGYSSVIADALANGKEIRVIPNVKDPEQALNALMCSAYELGEDLGQIELLGMLALDDLEKSFERELKINSHYEPVGKLLDERISELWESMSRST